MEEEAQKRKERLAALRNKRKQSESSDATKQAEERLVIRP